MENNVYIVYDAHYDYYEWLDVVAVTSTYELAYAFAQNNNNTSKEIVDIDSNRHNELREREIPHWV